MSSNGCWAWSSGDTGSLCYWNFFRKEDRALDEESLCYFEQRREREEFMSDWLEYVGEYNG
jgi:hypothetical protein